MSKYSRFVYISFLRVDTIDLCGGKVEIHHQYKHVSGATADTPSPSGPISILRGSSARRISASQDRTAPSVAVGGPEVTKFVTCHAYPRAAIITRLRAPESLQSLYITTLQ